MIMLDSNICIDVINQRPPKVLERFRQFRADELARFDLNPTQTAP